MLSFLGAYVIQNQCKIMQYKELEGPHLEEVEVVDMSNKQWTLTQEIWAYFLCETKSWNQLMLIIIYRLDYIMFWTWVICNQPKQIWTQTMFFFLSLTK